MVGSKHMKIENLIFTGNKPIELQEDGKTSLVEVLRVGIIQDRGLSITMPMLKQYVQNYIDDVYGTELQVNFNHFRGDEAAGWINDLFIKGESLMAKIEWTELGVEKITKKLFKFVSSELAFEFPHADTGEIVSNVFIGCALTNTPAMKRQKPLKLSEVNKLNNFISMFKKYIAELKERSKVTKEDIAFARTLLEEVPAEEKEAMTAEVDEVEKKVEEEVTVEEAEKEEDKAEETPKEDSKEELKEKSVSLAEYNTLKQKVELRDMQDLATENLLLKEGTNVGLNDADLSDAVKFMLTLNDSQRKEFVALMGKVKHVEFNTLGSTRVPGANLSDEDSKDDARVALAEKYLKEGKAKTIEEAQDMALAEIK